jgi:hypothetical protein
MKIKKVFLLAGVAAIPCWYLYRTLSDNRVPRLQWNEIFLTEDDRLRKELEATKKKAEEEIQKVKTEASEKEEQKRVADDLRSCLSLAKQVRTDLAAYAEVENRSRAEMDSLLHTKAGAVIAENEDYVRAFQEFHREADSEERLKEYGVEIDGIAQICTQSAKDDTGSASIVAEARGLQTRQQYFRDSLSSLNQARSKVAILLQIANGQAPENLEVAIQRKRIREMVENYKWERDRQRMFGHP